MAAGLQAPTLFVIARDLNTLQLEARVDESDVGRRRSPAQPVTFTVDAYPRPDVLRYGAPGAPAAATVIQNVVSYTTVIDVPNPTTAA